MQKAPSQRFRFEHFFKFIQENGWEWDFQSFTSDRGWKYLYSQTTIIHNLVTIISGFLRRFSLLFRINQYDTLFIHRELTPFGPPVFEWILAKVLGKRIIYDFDDAIWMNDGHDGNVIWTWLKWRSKIRSICRWSWKISAGNDFLAEFARKYNNSVVVMPTAVDTEVHRPLATSENKILRPDDGVGTQNDGKIIVGWTGSHTTMFYLNEIVPALKELEKKYDFEFHVISNKNPNLDLDSFRFIPWNKEREIEDLNAFDIGIMPLEDTEWAKGKCGFKLIQYGAMGIPSVASPVGVNKEIISEGENGFFASNHSEWIGKITLLQNTEVRQKMGKEAREVIENRYSVRSLTNRFVSLFEIS